ncbi:MAG TPA: glutamate formimidoyltransferase [Acidobacteriota bacterium]|nr:glutamate formimidoyltransferase [Acidobacteriota bacterium]
MDRIVQCVPNFSEGRDENVIREIAAAAENVSGVRLLDVDPGADTNRTVVTFIGEPEAVAEAAFQATRRASELIDMRRHSGAHPRFGATDVVPFVPVSGVTMDDCAEIARQVGKRIGTELGIPVYLYENAATRPERRNLSRVRAGEYEGLGDKLADPEWAPDFGPVELNARAGATAVGAREFLVAYNIDLNTTDRRYANEIAYAVRERGRWKRTGNIEPFYYKGEVVRFAGDGTYPCGPCGFVGSSFEDLEGHYREEHGADLRRRYEDLGIDPDNPTGPVYTDGQFTHVKGIGWVIDEFKRAQVSMNLTNTKEAAVHDVLEATREAARALGIVITGSEIVGLVPYEVMHDAAAFYLRRMRKSTGLPVPDLMETAIQSMGLRDVAPFEAADKVLAMPRMDGSLVNRTTFDFVDEVSRDTPAPGGGSVAALAGALGSALATMVANLSAGKGEFDDRYDELCSIAERGQTVKDALVRGVDADTSAFDKVLDAMRMPRDTEAQQAERDNSMQEGYKAATRVPLATVQQCRDALQLCSEIAAMADPEMVSDAGTGALLAHAGAQAAAYNVRINLRHIDDASFDAEMRGAIESTLAECSQLATAVAGEVDRVLAAD